MRLSLPRGTEVVVQSLFANESSLLLYPGEKYGLETLLDSITKVWPLELEKHDDDAYVPPIAPAFCNRLRRCSAGSVRCGGSPGRGTGATGGSNHPSSAFEHRLCRRPSRRSRIGLWWHIGAV